MRHAVLAESVMAPGIAFDFPAVASFTRSQGGFSMDGIRVVGLEDPHIDQVQGISTLDS